MRIGQFIDMIEKRLYTYKTQYILRKLIMLNDTNPMSGLPSHNGIDVMGNPHGMSNETNDSYSNDNSSIHLNWWTWKVDVFIILLIIATNVYIFTD
jgi:hypothetical protein